jgi:hypothetical protein
MQIAMAHTACDRSHQDLVWSGFVDLHFLDGERLVGRAKNGGFDSHRILLSPAFILLYSTENFARQFTLLR